ncbi:MAG: ATP-binding protein [Ignavibacteriaceae bacterium]
MDNFAAHYKIIQNKIKRSFSGERKYLTLVLLLIFFFLTMALVSPYLIVQKKNNWETILAGKIRESKEGTLDFFREKQLLLLEKAEIVKKTLTDDPSDTSETLRKYLFDHVNDPLLSSYNYEIYDGLGQLVAWNKNILQKKTLVPDPSHNPGETYFDNNPLYTNLVYYDTVIVRNRKFSVFLGIVLEKKFSFELDQQSGYSLTKELEDIFETNIDIIYSPSMSFSKDGRNSSFELLNNGGHKIGLVTVAVPTLNQELNSLREKISTIQSVLLILAFIMLGFGLRGDYKKIKYQPFKVSLFVVYVVVFRYLLFYIGLPGNLIWRELSNPSHFSSTSGGGIVKSPVELFITSLMFLIIVMYLLYQLFNYLNSGNRKRQIKKYLFLIIAPIIAFFVFGGIRALAASIKSVIYDSSLNYFAGTDLIPDFLNLFMNLSVLIFSTALVIVLLLLILLYFSLMVQGPKSELRRNIFYTFLIYLLGSALYILAQSEPLISFPLLFLVLFLVFILSFKIYGQNKVRMLDYLILVIFSSIISVSFLNHFNSIQEKESLRTIANEVNRQNESLRNFLVGESLIESYKSDELISGLLKRETNYNSLAFRVWSGSAMRSEDIFSSVTILDKNKKNLGGFSGGIDESERVPQLVVAVPIDELKTFTLVSEKTGNNMVSGIIPVKDREKKIGYLCVTITTKDSGSGNPDVAKLFYSKKKNRDISPNFANIFSVFNRTVTPVQSDLVLDRQVLDLLRDGDFSRQGELWEKVNINNENHILFALRSNKGKDNHYTVVTLKEKDLEWSVFNFFKLFILHSAFILILLFLILVKNFKSVRELRFTFKSQLLTSFLIISLIPLLALAIYNRSSVSVKSENLVRSSLREKAVLVEQHIKTQIKNNPDRPVLTAAEKAFRELRISFNFYDSSRVAFTSNADLLSAGVIPELLNPSALQSLRLIGLNEEIVKNNFESVEYRSFFKKARINSRSYIIEVNDIFNKLENPFSPLEIDVFIFGSYSVAILIIIFISTFLAGRISAPIRNLTNATNSVALGDLNVEVEKVEYGEIRELINGFNYMTAEIKRNQRELGELERESAWREMAKQVAHEIKNPLTPMKLALQQLIASYKDGTKNFDAIFDKVTKTILQQIDTLSQIASEFSSFARMPGIKLANVDLLLIINEVKNLFTHERAALLLETSVTEAVIEADENNLRRVLINLVRNSIQAKAEIITIRLSKEDDYFYISVADNGVGIPEEIRDKIFETDFSTKKSGMGLGLKLAKRFLSSIGGEIYLNRDNKQETEFIIKLLKPVLPDRDISRKEE